MPRRLQRALLFSVAAGALSWVVAAAWGVPTAMGASRRELHSHVGHSKHEDGGRFRNTRRVTTPMGEDLPGVTRTVAAGYLARRPVRPVPVHEPSIPETAAELAVTWFGHSSALVELDGHRVLLDPVWSARVSPSRLAGPRRLHPAPGRIEELPAVDAILISHDHYDHLDLPSVRALTASQAAVFVVPIGVGVHLRGWGVPAERVVELDWGEHHDVGELRLGCTESRHFSGRGIGNNPTQWASWVLRGPRHRVYFGGDTGYGPALAQIGEQHGPFDLTLVPIGAYSHAWPEVHLFPEQAVRAHRDLNGGTASGTGGLMMPIHWATFALAFHGWSEPISRTLAAARDHGVDVLVPEPGHRRVLDPAGSAPGEPVDWWSSLTSRPGMLGRRTSRPRG